MLPWDKDANERDHLGKIFYLTFNLIFLSQALEFSCQGIIAILCINMWQVHFYPRRISILLQRLIREKNSH